MELLFDPVGDVVAARAAEAEQAGRPQALGREEFLKLLIAQLENQDPMQPAKDTEFIAQLATFSSLEQLITANDNLEGLAIGQANLINAQVLNLIGKEALVEAGDEVRVVDGSPESLIYTLPMEAQSATVRVYDDAGTLLRTIELQTTPGTRHTLDWSAVEGDDDAERLADGTYRIEVSATGLDGEPLPVGLFKALPIDGVHFSELGIALVSGDREIPYESILEIRTAQPQG